MAFFKFRKDMDDADNASAQSLSMAAIRQRAKYRLVGAAVLVGVGVVSLPLLLEGQPRPLAINTPIEIPDKNKMPALVIPAASAVVAASAPPAKAAAVPIITEPAEVPAKPKEFKENKAVATVPIAQQARKTIATEAAKPVVKPASTVVKPVMPVVKPAVVAAPDIPAVVVAPPVAAQAKALEAARAKAILEGIDPPAAAAAPGRFIVQIGAFTDAVRAQEVRLKVERTGLKTYTHVAETSDGRRIRVRVGPFNNRDEAEKVAAKIKKLDLPAALLTL